MGTVRERDKADCPTVPSAIAPSVGWLGRAGPDPLALKGLDCPADPGVPSVESTCPLCGDPGSRPFHADARRPYRQCGACRLVFVPAAWHLSAAAEKAQYDLHENDLGDAGYRRFLSRIADAATARVAPGARALDVGCGPAPLLARMLGEAGIVTAVYDPFYAPDAQAWSRRYDLVTASEVVEHFRAPAAEFARLFAAVRPGGWLVIMTKRVRDAASFPRWHYILDPTHVAFYSLDTFTWLARRHGATLEVAGDDVVAFRTGADDNGLSPPPGSP